MPDRLERASPASPESATAGGLHNNSPLFSSATMCARQGEFSTALKLLKESRERGERPEPENLDLEARIYAQQGMLVRAESCWLRALELDPGSRTYMDAIAVLRRVHDPLRWFRFRLLMLAGAAALMFGFWLFTQGYLSVRRQQDALADKLVAVQDTMDSARAAQDRSQRDFAARLDAIDEAFRRSRADTASAIAGLSTKDQVDESFQQLTAESRALLDRVNADVKKRDELTAAQRTQELAALREDLTQARKAIEESIKTSANAQAELAATLQAARAAQSNDLKVVLMRQHQFETSLSDAIRDSQAHASAVAAHTDQIQAVTQEQLKALQEQIDRIFWFRRPSRKPHNSAPLRPVTTNSGESEHR